MGPNPNLWLLHVKQRLLDQHISLYGFQTSPVVLCIQNGVISTRITSLYGSQPSSVAFPCKIATFGTPYKSLWVPDLNCRFVLSNSVISTGITSLYGFQPSSVVLCNQNSDLKTKLHVSMGPRPHL